MIIRHNFRFFGYYLGMRKIYCGDFLETALTLPDKSVDLVFADPPFNVSKKYLDRLKEQREKLNSRILLAENKVKSSERKKDTRRKILIGAYYLDSAIKENKMHEVKSIMEKYLKRNSDRALFDLDQITEST